MQRPRPDPKGATQHEHRREEQETVAGEDRKDSWTEKDKSKKLGRRHSDGHINNLSLFSRVTGHSTGSQKCPACPLLQSQTLQEVP